MIWGRLKAFLCRTWHVWAMVLAVIVPLLSIVLNPAEIVARYAGASLQLIGIGTAVFGLVEISRTFEVSLLSELRSALGELRRRNIVIVAGTGAIAAAGQAVGLIIGKVKLPPSATVDQRVTFLEEKIDHLSDAAAKLRESIDRETAKLEKAIEDQERSLQVEIDGLHETMKKAFAGSLPVQWVGVPCLLLGTFLSAIAPDVPRIAAWLSLFWHWII